MAVDIFSGLRHGGSKLESDKPWGSARTASIWLKRATSIMAAAALEWCTSCAPSLFVLMPPGWSERSLIPRRVRVGGGDDGMTGHRSCGYRFNLTPDPLHWVDG